MRRLNHQIAGLHGGPSGDLQCAPRDNRTLRVYCNGEFLAEVIGKRLKAGLTNLRPPGMALRSYRGSRAHSLVQPSDLDLYNFAHAIAENCDIGFLANCSLSHKARKLAGMLDFGAGKGKNNIALTEACGFGRSALIHARNDGAPGSRKVQAGSDIVARRLEPQANPTPASFSVALELIDDPARGVRRNSKAKADAAARRRENRRIDADDLPCRIEERATGVSPVDRGVGLQEIVVGAGVDVAAAAGQDSSCDRAIKAERITDRQNPVADARARRVTKRHSRKRLRGLGRDFEKGDVGFGIAA